MSNLFLAKKNPQLKGELFLGGSKSESNRLLILNALYDNLIQLKNLSDAEDTQILSQALQSTAEEIDIHHAGTAMRFLTAYSSIQPGTSLILTGSERMKQRPIGILVDALKSLGATITYLEKEGFPPLKIQGKEICKDFVELSAETSSQFITALMLIAPKLPNGLTIQLNGKITSLPYLLMTVEILESLGIQVEQEANQFKIFPKTVLAPQEFTVESDWSSASYFYSFAAFAETVDLKLNYFNAHSLQGDAALVAIYEKYFGIQTQFNKHQIHLTKREIPKVSQINLDLNFTPDIAQTLAVTCAGLKIPCKFTGLETLRIKETDRLSALKNELAKIGVKSETTDSTFEILGFEEVNVTPLIKTYNDHRMAMSFAPLSYFMDLEIENPEVVEKSYPNFWKDLGKLE